MNGEDQKKYLSPREQNALSPYGPGSAAGRRSRLQHILTCCGLSKQLDPGGFMNYVIDVNEIIGLSLHENYYVENSKFLMK